MIVGSLDIGIRNIGFAIYCSETKTISHLEIIDLLRIPNSQARLPFGDQSVVFLVKRAIHDRLELFKSCDYVGIEKQLTRKMVLIQLAFECLLDSLTEVFQISARAVKTMHGTSRGKHALNKRAAITKCLSLLDDKSRAIVVSYKKKDDICDAILQAMYMAEHLETLKRKKNAACCIKSKKKRKGRKRKRIPLFVE